MYLLPLDRVQQKELIRSLGQSGFLSSVLDRISSLEFDAAEENDEATSNAALKLYRAVEHFGLSPLNELGDYGIFEQIVELTRGVEQREPWAIHGLQGRRDWLKEVELYQKVMAEAEYLLQSSRSTSQKLNAINRRIAQEKFALVRERKGS